MSKYEPLTHFLERSRRAVVEMTFAEIERVIGADLPPSTYKHRTLWSNNTVGHVMARAWIAAGFQSEQVDLEGQRVVFRRIEAEATAPAMTATERGKLGQERLARMMGCMRGTISIPEGVDIMEPIELDWDAMKD